MFATPSLTSFSRLPHRSFDRPSYRFRHRCIFLDTLIAASKIATLPAHAENPALVHRPTRWRSLTCTAALVLVFAPTCRRQDRSDSRTDKLTPIYNKKTGRLEQLKYDSDGDGTFDTFSYMDGPTVVRIEIDRDEDGKIDRWEYYGPGKKLERVGLSRAHNGVEDSVQYFDSSGALTRVEMTEQGPANKRVLARIEYYEKGVLVRAEEDTDRDGSIDKWEGYENNRLASVAFDERHEGRPTRRLVYSPDGTARIEQPSQQTTRRPQ